MSNQDGHSAGGIGLSDHNHQPSSTSQNNHSDHASPNIHQTSSMDATTVPERPGANGTHSLLESSESEQTSSTSGNTMHLRHGSSHPNIPSSEEPVSTDSGHRALRTDGNDNDPQLREQSISASQPAATVGVRAAGSGRTAVLADPEVLSDPDYSDPEAPPVEIIDADEDILDDEDLQTEDIDLVHCRVSSIPALHLERFESLRRLCLRQNAIQSIDLPDSLGQTLEELDLYDNLINHLKGLDSFTLLTSLDLSFNKLKHIKNVSHLTSLRELYFVQNRISRIENLSTLTSLTMIELAANRIRTIENLDRLTSLRELWLGKNKIGEITNLSPLVNLRVLDLKSNRLTSISGLSGLANLEELYVSHNAIEAIGPDSLRDNVNLTTLDISNNRITRLENIAHLTHLTEFWASVNGLSDFREVERELKDKQELETVYFEANPLQLNGPAVYRNKVRLALPQVKQIDATFVRV